MKLLDQFLESLHGPRRLRKGTASHSSASVIVPRAVGADLPGPRSVATDVTSMRMVAVQIAARGTAQPHSKPETLNPLAEAQSLTA